MDKQAVQELVQLLTCCTEYKKSGDYMLMRMKLENKDLFDDLLEIIIESLDNEN